MLRHSVSDSDSHAASSLPRPGARRAVVSRRWEDVASSASEDVVGGSLDVPGSNPATSPPNHSFAFHEPAVSPPTSAGPIQGTAGPIEGTNVVRILSRVLTLAALLLAACGGPLDAPECGPDNCDGCCDGNVCMDGDLNQACGTGGEACDACPAGERCFRNVCVERVAPCNAQTCDGCCAGNECRPGTSNSACGIDGRSCMACGDGLECREGGCAEPIKPPCDSITCPGCCVDGECMSGFDDLACGTGGIACESCSAGESCEGGRCYDTASECGLSTCSGCCQDGQCLVGNDDAACGQAGAACRACADGAFCNETGRCVEDTRPCSPETCSGCCADGVCVDGRAVDACGVGGGECLVCADGQHCNGEACSWELPSCGPWNCAGCCVEGECVDGTDALACGVDGAECQACDSGAGTTCRNGTCQEPAPPCTGDNCAGCCLNGVCLDGTFASACGQRGVACDVCENGERCSSGSCVEDGSYSACGPHNCAGCCEGFSCHYGDDPTACGSHGGMCVACGAGQACRDGVCVPESPGTCGDMSCGGCCNDGICLPGTSVLACGDGGEGCSRCQIDQLCIDGSCSGEAQGCDSFSCDGCCRDGVCLSGLALNACGVAGSECVGCEKGFACVSGTCIEPADQADWTVLVYMSADGPLDSFAMANVREMFDLGRSTRLNMVALVDRGVTYAKESIPGPGLWSGAKLLRLSGGAAVELADWGEVDMGDPRTLRRFIVEGTAAHPARNTALVLWGHGAGWDGFGLDSSSNDSMTLSELRNGIATGLAESRLKRFDLIGFDASLMGSLEVAYQVRGLADYFVGSPELMPGRGWDYRDLAEAIITAPGVLSPMNLAIRVVDGFAARSPSDAISGQETLTALNMAYVEELATATQELGRALERSVTSMASWRELARSLSTFPRIHRFGYGPDGGGTLVDLDEFLNAAFPVLDGSAVGGDVFGGLSLALLKAHVGERSFLGGVSIYLPTEHTLLNPRYVTTDFASKGGWMAFVRRYLGFAAQSDEAISAAELYVDADPLGASLSTRISTGASIDRMTDLSLVYGVRDEDSWDVTLMSFHPLPLQAGTQLSSRWDLELPFLSDGTSHVPAALFDLPAPIGLPNDLVVTPFEYQAPATQSWLPVLLVLELGGDRSTGQVVRAWSMREHGAAEITLEELGRLRPVLPLGDVNHDLRLTWRVTDEPKWTLTVGEEPLSLSVRRVDAGEYEFGVAIRDLAGNWSIETQEVEVSGFGPIAVGQPCDEHSSCQSGHCLHDTYSGKSECTASCSTDADCPEFSNTWCGSTSYGDHTVGVCRNKLPEGASCDLGHHQCESGACFSEDPIDGYAYTECVASCIDDWQCEAGSECRDLGGGVKGCVY